MKTNTNGVHTPELSIRISKGVGNISSKVLDLPSYPSHLQLQAIITMPGSAREERGEGISVLYESQDGELPSVESVPHSICCI